MIRETQLSPDGIVRFDLELEVWLDTARMRAAGIPAQRLSRSNFRDSWWTVAQMLAHHTVNGCNLEPGDLLGSGTQSGPTPGEAGSLLELSGGGKRAIALAGGEQRTFLEDGDEVVDWVLAAYEHDPGPLPRALIVYGPFMVAERQAAHGHVIQLADHVHGGVKAQGY